MLLRRRNQELVNDNKLLKNSDNEYRSFRNSLPQLLARVGEYVTHMDKDENVQKATEKNVAEFDGARDTLITLVQRLCDVGTKYRSQLGM